MHIEMIFGHNERDEESIFINNDGASAAKPFDHRNILFLHRIEIKKAFWLARDSHHNGTRGSLIDDAKTSVVRTKKSFFKLELLEDGLIFEMDEMNFRANN